MNEEDAPKLSRAEQLKEAQTYLWHLTPPWTAKYSHDHWWDRESRKKCHAAAFWELFRRHPQTENILKNDYLPSNLLEWFIHTHHLKSWIELDSSEINEWQKILINFPPVRGYDLCPVYSVTLQSVDVREGANPQAALTLDKGLKETAKTDPEHAKILKISETCRELEIARLAIEHHKQGHILIAVSPSAANFEYVVENFKDCFLMHRTELEPSSEPTERARFIDWFIALREFEVHELERFGKLNEKRDAKLFEKYRRAISRVSLSTPFNDSGS